MSKAGIKVAADLGSTIFAHPDDITHSLRFTRKLTDKTVNGVQVTNLRSEVIQNKTVPVSVCQNTCAGHETLSVRTSISGSLKNSESVNALIDEQIAALQAFKSARGASGFPVDSYAFTA